MSRPVLLLLNGPNLDQLGVRDPAVYGTATLGELVADAQAAADAHGFDLEHVQSASEAELVAAVHGARGRCAAIIINAGALTHYAWSLHDALDIFGGIVVELHISNVAKREPWRHTSVIAPVATALIAGFGATGYVMAVEGAIRLVNTP